jgi:hypothetical protein
VAAIKNAWGKVRAGLAKAVSAPRAWFSRVGDGIGWATSGTRSAIAHGARYVREGVSHSVGHATEAPRAQISDWVDQARERPTVAVAIAAGALVGIAWIAWGIYVTASNGANAGLGVLITWPVLIGALALVAAPFVGGALLVKRFWPEGEGDPS